MNIHIQNMTISMGSSAPIPKLTTIKIGDAWPNVDGIYAGISRGEGDEPDVHLVLLNAFEDKDMSWQNAKEWAESVGGRLPTRMESALLYANLRDKLDAANWLWTGSESQSSSSYAWCQLFYDGGQSTDGKLSTFRARAVSRFPL